MMQALPETFSFSPGWMEGTIAAPLSKSAAHRAMIAAALQGVPQPPLPPPLCEDLLATRNALEHFPFAQPAVIDCGESGSTLRFLLPVIAARPYSPVPVTVIGHGRLPERPIAELLRVLRENHAVIQGEKLPLQIFGGLQPGVFTLPGDQSSQFLSGLLFAFPLLKGGPSEIRLTTPLQSAPYVEMTRQALAASRPADILEGDWSNAAFWLCAGALSSRPLVITGLKPDSFQGDRAICDILQRFGAAIDIQPEGIRTAPSNLHGAGDIDMRDIPDLLPVLAATAASAKGTTHFVNAARLRLKECDRLAGMAGMLSAAGVAVREESDRLEVTGGSAIHSVCLESQNDHRLVMAAALLSLRAEGDIRLSGADAVAKSYPGFFQDYASCFHPRSDHGNRQSEVLS